MFLSQRKYVVEILERAHMVNCNPSQTPVDTESKLGDDGDPVSNLTLYQSLADLVADGQRNTVNDIGNSAFMSTSKLNDSALLHARLGHIHFKRMQDMSEDELIPAFDMDTK
ncbi:ribonuclease H-like domain-containing protein [Tanacetum coccineum]